MHWTAPPDAVPSPLPNVSREVRAMPHLNPPTLTKAEQQSLLAASSVHPRDYVIFSLAPGT